MLTSVIALSAEAPKIAVIIDDVGNQLRPGMRAVELPGPIALAVLPHTPYATRLAVAASGKDKEVLVHMPMQAAQASDDPGPGTLHLALTRTQFDQTLAAALLSVPGAIGINNHMGSLLTRDTTAMHWLMQAVKSDGRFFFVDSYTTHLSVGLMIAREHEVPALKRDVFLDVVPTIAAIGLAWNALVAQANEAGYAVAIAHPYPETLEFLERELIDFAGAELVPLSNLLGYQSVQRSYAELVGGVPTGSFFAPDPQLVH